MTKFTRATQYSFFWHIMLPLLRISFALLTFLENSYSSFKCSHLTKTFPSITWQIVLSLFHITKIIFTISYCNVSIFAGTYISLNLEFLKEKNHFIHCCLPQLLAQCMEHMRYQNISAEA